MINGRSYNSIGPTRRLIEVDVDEKTRAPDMISETMINRIKKHTCRI
jgi:hypothetical protein